MILHENHLKREKKNPLTLHFLTIETCNEIFLYISCFNSFGHDRIDWRTRNKNTSNNDGGIYGKKKDFPISPPKYNHPTGR